MILSLVLAATVISNGDPPMREGALAISPANSRIVLAAAIAGTVAPRADVHTFRSVDGGRTWSPLGVVPKRLGAETLIGHWDPVFAFDREGRAYLVVVAALNETRWRIALYRSEDNGTTWSGAAVSQPSVERNDKPWIAVGDDDSVHIVWHGFGTYGTSYVVSRDRGQTFSEPKLFPGAGWPFVATAPGGNVYVSHPAPRYEGWDIAHSSDGGATFSVQQVISRTPAALPHMIAADRDNVYAFMPAADAVYFSRSIDHGTTWSEPVRFAGPSGAWLPSLAVDRATGEVVLTWQERVSPTQARVMTTSSFDRGATFATPRPVSPVFDASRPHGEYNQLVASRGAHLIVWSDDAGVFSIEQISAPSSPASRRRAVRR